ncbi:MAG: hypothetical protein K0R14_187 [Burkholderiales bacterium]|jgi:hypothetical protein|nr:hypothetical protein [Burkholderiales bacterium]
MLRIKIGVLFLLAFSNIFAIVPVDTSLDTANVAAMANYTGSVNATFGSIKKAMDVTQQLQNLQGLRNLANSGLCSNCTGYTQKQLRDYANSVNDDLCLQFSTAYKNLTGIQNAANSLSDIMTLMQVNPKAAMMSLQQAAISAQAATNSILVQMQLMQTQEIQKRMADERVRDNNTQTIAEALRHPGL